MTQETKKKKSEQVPLTAEEQGEGFEIQSQGNPVKGIIISIIVSIIVFFIMGTFLMPTVNKNTYQADITRLEKDLLQMQETDKSLHSKIDGQNSRLVSIATKGDEISLAISNHVTNQDLVNNLKNYTAKNDFMVLQNEIMNNVKRDELQSYATAESLKSYATIESIKNHTTDTTLQVAINNIVANLTTEQLIALKTRLNATIITDAGQTGLGIKLTRIGNTLVPSDNKTLTGTMKVVITNTTGQDISDVIVLLNIQTAIIPNVASISLISSPAMTWTNSGWFGYETQYNNGFGLTIQANKSKTIYLTFTVNGNSSANYTIPYEYQVSQSVEY